MAEFQNFRTALSGFNREDVVHYLEYLNHRHASEVSQLKGQLQALQEQLDAAQSAPRQDEDLLARLEAAEARCAELENAQLPASHLSEDELEAYRRAERAERSANERVARLYQQANGALAEATVQVDDAASQIAAVTDAVTAQLSQLQTAVAAGKNTLRSAAAALYAVRPLESEE